MLKTLTPRFLATALVAVCVTITLPPAGADELAARFCKPPAEARPLTWWHWLDGNITREGITADWEAIQRAGLGGAYLFNCGIGMPPGDVRFMQPKWLEMLDHTIREAERLGLKFGVHNCDGFSQSGGPWITAETCARRRACILPRRKRPVCGVAATAPSGGIMTRIQGRTASGCWRRS